MNVYLLSFLISAGYVAAKSCQQLNTHHKLYWLIPPFSIIMAVFDIYVIHMISKNGMEDLMWLALSLGLGGGFGSCTAVYLHDKLITSKEKNNDNP